MSDNSFIDYYSQLKISDPAIYSALIGEQQRQQDGVELIPAENYTYPEVLGLLGSVFTNKYSEGYPGRRYYGGQEFTDNIEVIARERACQVFRGEHANVQPLSGSPMNQAVYFALLEPGDTILAMDLSHGGHLTHGAPVSPILVEAKGGPIVLFRRGKNDEIFVRLDTGGYLWAQYSYQFAHEFCHILCRYDQDKTGNKWFEETARPIFFVP